MNPPKSKQEEYLSIDEILTAIDALDSTEYEAPSTILTPFGVWLAINGFFIINRRGRNKLVWTKFRRLRDE